MTAPKAPGVGKFSAGAAGQSFFYELSLRCYENKRKADMAYRSRAHRHPAHSPHTRMSRTCGGRTTQVLYLRC